MIQTLPIASFLPPILGAKMSTDTLIMAGAMLTMVVTMITFTNWKLGVKTAFVMVLFEGAIRKWVVPGAQELAYFIKDIVIIGAYLRFFFFPDPSLKEWRLRMPVGMIAMLCAMVSLSSLNPNIGSSILAVYGLKIYMFYLPLAFILPFLFKDKDDLLQNVFWYAMLATPICLLGVAQYAMPGDNFLNVMAQGGEGTGMGWSGSKIRVTGTFSYISGHATFLTVFFAIHLALLMNELKKWQWVCLICNLPLLAGNALMNGSRTSVVLIAFIGAGFGLMSMVYRIGTKGNAIVKIGVVGAVMAMGVSYYFGEAKEQFKTRVDNAGDSIYSRTVGMPLESIHLGLDAGGVFGYGIGMTHPALERLRSVLGIPVPKAKPPVFDTEIGQVMAELGLIGWVCWYALRTIFFFLTIGALRLAEPGPLRALIVASIMIQLPHLLMGIVLNHTANFLVFGFVGVSMIPYLQYATQTKIGHRLSLPRVWGGDEKPDVPAPGYSGVRGSRVPRTR